jgi:hypothetical protein
LNSRRGGEASGRLSAQRPAEVIVVGRLEFLEALDAAARIGEEIEAIDGHAKLLLFGPPLRGLLGCLDGVSDDRTPPWNRLEHR